MKVGNFIKLQHQKDLGKYFTGFDIPQVVLIHVNKSKFLVNSIILALHSSVFENLILAGNDDITLHQNFHFSDAEYIIRDCLLYLYGKGIELKDSNVYHFYNFASYYKIDSLLTHCRTFILSSLNANNVIEKYMAISDEPVLCDTFLEYMATKSEETINKIFALEASSSLFNPNLGDLLTKLVQCKQFQCKSLFMHRFEDLPYKKILPKFSNFKTFMGLLTNIVKEPLHAVRIINCREKYLEGTDGLTAVNNVNSTANGDSYYAASLGLAINLDLANKTSSPTKCATDSSGKNTTRASVTTVMKSTTKKAAQNNSSCSTKSPKNISNGSEIITKTSTKDVKSELGTKITATIKNAANSLTTVANKASSSTKCATDIPGKKITGSPKSPVKKSATKAPPNHLMKSALSSSTKTVDSSSEKRSVISDQNIGGKGKQPDLTLETRTWLSLSLQQIIKSVTQKMNNVCKDLRHSTIDIFLTWLHIRKFQLNDINYKLFLGSFNNTLLSREYMLDVKEVLSTMHGSTHKVDVKYSDKNFFISECFKRSELLHTINHQGAVHIQNSSEKCEVSSCTIADHVLTMKIQLNKTVCTAPSEPIMPLGITDNTHRTNIVHYYLLALDDENYVKNILSLKVLSKKEIIEFIQPYKQLLVKVILCKK